MTTNYVGIIGMEYVLMLAALYAALLALAVLVSGLRRALARSKPVGAGDSARIGTATLTVRSLAFPGPRQRRR